jgi:hypothetical protein
MKIAHFRAYRQPPARFARFSTFVDTVKGEIARLAT